jgi:hypothetical protein
MPVAVVPAIQIPITRHLAPHAERFILTLPRTSSTGWLNQGTINRRSATNRKVDGIW